MKFKVGDQVRVLRKAKSHARGWENSWVSNMDAAVGKIGRVTSLSGALHDVTVRVPGTGGDEGWGYPDFVLKLVPKPARKRAVKK